MEENETESIISNDPGILVAKISGIVSESCRLVTDVEEALVLLSAREVTSAISNFTRLGLPCHTRASGLYLEADTGSLNGRRRSC
jgi:hypothetical protein